MFKIVSFETSFGWGTRPTCRRPLALGYDGRTFAGVATELGGQDQQRALDSRVNGVCDSVTGAVNSAERASETRLADCIPTDATVIQALTLCAMSDATPMWQAMAVSVVNLFSLCKKRGRRNNSLNSASAIYSRLEGKGCDMHTACNATDGEDVA